MPDAERAAGRVYLVGAGPGDAGLMSARALELIAAADVILHDRLIPDGALDGARRDAQLFYVGKEGGGEAVAQEHTQELLVAHARAGRTVVRLKGGDPFVFGRGGEEALALARAGVPFEVVPGITSGVAASAYAGIPVTQRGVASAVALVTGHEDPDKEGDTLDWRALAAFPGTLVFYMGVRQLERIASSLIEAGRSAQEPAAVIENGTLPGQRAVSAPLAGIARAARDADVRAPSVTVVGRVCELAQQIAWREPQPLAGLTVAVTRARAQASELARRLRELGARVVQAPAIRTTALATEPLDPSGFDLVCVTSANGAQLLFERLAAAGLDARSLAGACVAAIGPGTAQVLAAHGIVADVVPERSVAESLVDALARVPARRALIARAREARDVLPDALRERGVEVEVVSLYETAPEPLDARTLELARRADYVTFTSASTVRFFLEALGDAVPPRGRLVSIGPVTSAALRERGLEPDVEAESHDLDGLVRALLEDARERAREPRR